MFFFRGRQLIKQFFLGRCTLKKKKKLYQCCSVFREYGSQKRRVRSVPMFGGIFIIQSGEGICVLQLGL